LAFYDVASIIRQVLSEGVVTHSPGVWTSLGPKRVYKEDAAGKLHAFDRYHYVLRVSFVVAGSIGKFDIFTLLINLAGGRYCNPGA
jgi:hypothetical protein